MGNIITDSRFRSSFLSKFNLVINALDNIEARSHMNRVCLSNGIPLIDGGSTGLIGTLSVVVKG